ncbi:MAG: carboxypeptidase regulatory-like domain-containing protein, partial [Longimicrobiales bacterium]
MRPRGTSREGGRRRFIVRLALFGNLILFCAPAAAQVAPPAQQDGPALLDRVVGLELRDVTLTEALAQIRRSTGIGLIYSPDLLPGDRRVSCPCQESTVAEALEEILRGTSLTFSASDTQVRIVPRPQLREGPPVGSVAGVVQDAEDGSPVANALVQLSDGRGSLTNENGRFILLNVPPGRYSLTVSGLGWDDVEVTDIQVEEGRVVAVAVSLTRRIIPLSELVIAPGTFGVLDQVSDFALQTLTREQIETFPQLGEDVFRSLQRLPGVASGDISTKLHLRGGRDREVLYVLDGMELYEPYHMKEFEGSLGVIDVQAVGGIDLHTGGFPVDYGNRMAGVFDMKTLNPPVEGTRTALGLSITNASVMSRGVFSEGKGEWLFSARRGYMDIALSLTKVSDDISPRYYDVLGKVQYQLGSKHLVSAHFLHAGDHLELEQDVIRDSAFGQLENGWGNTYGWVAWKAFLSPGVRARTLFSGGRISRSRNGFQEELGRVSGPEAAWVADEGRFDFVGVHHEWAVDFTDRFVA